MENSVSEQPRSVTPVIHELKANGGEWTLYPKMEDRSQYAIESGSTIVIPDLNANPLFLIHSLLRHNIIRLKSNVIPQLGKQVDEQAQFKILAAMQNSEYSVSKQANFLIQNNGYFGLKPLQHIIESFKEIIPKYQNRFMMDYNIFSSIIANIEFIEPTNIAGITLIGDELCDRVGDDIRVLLLLQALDVIGKKKNIKLNFIFSNHTYSFFNNFFMIQEALEQDLNPLKCQKIWDMLRQQYGYQQRALISSQMSMINMCFQISIIGLTYPNFAQGMFDRISLIIEKNYIPNLNLIQFYKDQSQKNIVLTHAPLVWSTDKSLPANVNLIGFINEFNTLCLEYNENLDSSQYQPFPLIDTNARIQDIFLNLNRSMRNVHMFKYLVRHFNLLYDFVFNRKLQTSPFPYGIINVHGHNSQLMMNANYCCIDSQYGKVDGITRTNDPVKNNLRLCFFKLSKPEGEFLLNGEPPTSSTSSTSSLGFNSYFSPARTKRAQADPRSKRPHAGVETGDDRCNKATRYGGN